MSRKRGRGSLSEYGKMAARVVRAYGRAFAVEGDLEELSQFANIGDVVEESTSVAVMQFREVGFSWDEIGAALRMSGDTARVRYGKEAAFEKWPVVYRLIREADDATVYVGRTRNLGQRLAMHRRGGSLEGCRPDVIVRLDPETATDDELIKQMEIWREVYGLAAQAL